MALKACTSCCSSAGVDSSGMRSRSDLAETEAATWVTSRNGRKPLRTSSQPSSPLSKAQSNSADHSQPLNVWQKALCAVTSSRISKVSRCRSEEHTSELQSLMRLSYAVFCLKNKNRQAES